MAGEQPQPFSTGLGTPFISKKAKAPGTQINCAGRFFDFLLYSLEHGAYPT